MTFEEFLEWIRDQIGDYCRDSYWEWIYNTLENTSRAYIISITPMLAINAIGTDSSTRMI